jgi:hypothetical protein
MTNRSLADVDVPSLEAVHEIYVEKLSFLNRLRCRREAKASPDYGARIAEARREASEAHAELVMLAQLAARALKVA